MNKFIEERWYMHLIGGAITVTPIIGLLIKFDPSFDIGKIAQVFIAGFFAYCIGLCGNIISLHFMKHHLTIMIFGLQY